MNLVNTTDEKVQNQILRFLTDDKYYHRCIKGFNLDKKIVNYWCQRVDNSKIAIKDICRIFKLFDGYPNDHSHHALAELFRLEIPVYAKNITTSFAKKFPEALAKGLIRFDNDELNHDFDDILDNAEGILGLEGEERFYFAKAHEGDESKLKHSAYQSKNLILYGPPGTGKTYNVIYEALSILEPENAADLRNSPSRRAEAVGLFNRYVDSNQVMFCTFHQSYSYEEFVEGIRYSEEKNRYSVQDGIFKKICDAARAATSERKSIYNFNPNETQFFKMSLGNTAYEDADEKFDYCINNNVIALGWGEDIDFTTCKNKQDIKKLIEEKYPEMTNFAVDAVERFKHWMQIGDIVIISAGNTKARAIGKITGEYTYNPNTPIEYYHFRKVEWLYTDSSASIPVQSILKQKIFSQQTIYLFLNNDLNMESIKELISEPHKKDKAPQFVLVIDEINRGNISKIFGELITLIEPDKRMGQPNEIIVQLPYSGDRLRVPSNVHILGTMNTADRSIALLDTALRRRFEFKEMMPEYSVLPVDIDGVNIRKMLETINARIEFLYDRDHVIGHSYFIYQSPNLAEYIRVMQNKVIPLLQEYFYEDWEQIERVLGGAGNPGDRTYLLNKVEVDAGQLFAKTTGLPERRKSRYTVQANPAPEALRRIYAAASSNQEEDEEE